DHLLAALAGGAPQDRRPPARAAPRSPRGQEDLPRAHRRGQGSPGPRGIRPAVRRSPLEAAAPTAYSGPSRAQDPQGRVQGGRNGRARLVGPPGGAREPGLAPRRPGDLRPVRARSDRGPRPDPGAGSPGLPRTARLARRARRPEEEARPRSPSPARSPRELA